jgi:hypothetical protein
VEKGGGGSSNDPFGNANQSGTTGGAAGTTGNAPRCGNGKREGAEVCDGSDLGGSTCATHGFSGGTLTCDATACMYDTSMCTGGGGSGTSGGGSGG